MPLDAQAAVGTGVRVLLLLLAASACGGTLDGTNPSLSVQQATSGDVIDDADEAAVTILRRCDATCSTPLLRHTQGFRRALTTAVAGGDAAVRGSKRPA